MKCTNKAVKGFETLHRKGAAHTDSMLSHIKFITYEITQGM